MEDYGDYMRNKIRKIGEFNREQYVKVNNIFANCKVYVDGYTKPSNVEIRELLCSRGGSYAYYLTQKSITHVIATQMPQKKHIQLRDAGIPVVTPEWITDCCKMEKLLDTSRYLLGIRTQERDSSGNKKNANKALIKGYFSKSRLHYLSEWRNLMKAKIGRAIANSGEDHSVHQDSLIEDPFLGEEEGERSTFIFHVDIDSFFASAIANKNPHLRDKPFVVCHSKGIANGELAYADVSCANYKARERGIRNGMQLGKAMKICPDLQSIPYDFPEFEATSMKFFQVLLSFTLNIEVVSCDEAYLDVSRKLEGVETLSDVFDLAKVLKERIFSETGCTASVGVGSNILLARLSTFAAKPDGISSLGFADNGTKLPDEELYKQLEFIPISHLPSLGYKSISKLTSLTKLGKPVLVLGELHAIPLKLLQEKLGEKPGLTVYRYCRGIDFRRIDRGGDRRLNEVENLPSSISVNMNYALRFKEYEEMASFLEALSEELEGRVQDLKGRSDLLGGRNVILRVRVRAADAPVVPRKYMGTGKCKSFQKSMTLPNTILDGFAPSLLSMMRGLIKKEDISVEDVRGIGVGLAKLVYGSSMSENKDTTLDRQPKRVYGGKWKKSEHKSASEGTLVRESRTDSESRDQEGIFLDEDMDSILQFLRDIVNHQSSGPLPEQVQILEMYIKQMIETFNMENALFTVRYLKLLGEGTPWSSCAKKLETVFRRSVREKYRKRCHPKIFLC